MAKRMGRPPIPEKDRKRSVSFSLTPPDIKRIEKMASRHGVTRSQIVFDSLQNYAGEAEQQLQHLRHELADQTAIADRMKADLEKMKEHHAKLEASQSLADAILNPYKSPDSVLTRTDQEKARTLRAILNVDNNRREVQLLASGEIQRPSKPVLMDALQVWGSWEALAKAVEASD